MASQGAQAFEVPKRLGLQKVKGGKGLMVYGRDYDEWVLLTEGIAGNAPRSVEEFLNWIPGQQRRLFLIAIRTALQQQHEAHPSFANNPPALSESEDMRKKEEIEQAMLEASLHSMTAENEHKYINFFTHLARSDFKAISTQCLLVLSGIQSSGSEEEREGARDLGMQRYQEMLDSEPDRNSPVLDKIRQLIVELERRAQYVPEAVRKQ